MSSKARTGGGKSAGHEIAVVRVREVAVVTKKRGLREQLREAGHLIVQGGGVRDQLVGDLGVFIPISFASLYYVGLPSAGCGLHQHHCTSMCPSRLGFDVGARRYRRNGERGTRAGCQTTR